MPDTRHWAPRLLNLLHVPPWPPQGLALILGPGAPEPTIQSQQPSRSGPWPGRSHSLRRTPAAGSPNATCPHCHTMLAPRLPATGDPIPSQWPSMMTPVPSGLPSMTSPISLSQPSRIHPRPMSGSAQPDQGSSHKAPVNPGMPGPVRGTRPGTPTPSCPFSTPIPHGQKAVPDVHLLV